MNMTIYDLAHSLWAMAQRAPGECISDGVARIADAIARYESGLAGGCDMTAIEMADEAKDLVGAACAAWNCATDWDDVGDAEDFQRRAMAAIDGLAAMVPGAMRATKQDARLLALEEAARLCDRYAQRYASKARDSVRAVRSDDGYQRGRECVEYVAIAIRALAAKDAPAPQGDPMQELTDLSQEAGLYEPGTAVDSRTNKAL